jgi:hypothetical protein
MNYYNNDNVFLNDEKNIKKCLKSFLVGKKYIDTDNDKAYEYLKQCIQILNDIKEKKIKVSDEYAHLIDETETECCKYLTQSLKTTIDKPLKKYNINNEYKFLFDIIDTGSIQKLKEYKYGEIDFTIYNENGLTPLHYAIKVGDTSFIKYALRIGAHIDITTKYGHTLLEYACLEKDPNMINFLSMYGSDMKKHIEFRDGKKYDNKGSELDILLLEKIVMNNSNDNDIKYLNFINNYLNNDEFIELEHIDKKRITIKEFIIKLDNLLDDLNTEARNTYLEIIKEELNHDLSFKLGCPTNKIHLILYNLVPFIDYNNLRLGWLLSLEIKYLIFKILRNKTKINTVSLKNELRELIYNGYSENQIVPDGLLQTIVLQWLDKIKV